MNDMLKEETRDLYYSAYLRTRGARLLGSQFDDLGRCHWTWDLSGCNPPIGLDPFEGYLKGATVSAVAFTRAVRDLKKMAAQGS